MYTHILYLWEHRNSLQQILSTGNFVLLDLMHSVANVRTHVHASTCMDGIEI